MPAVSELPFKAEINTSGTESQALPLHAQMLVDHLKDEEKRLKKLLKANRRAQENAAVIAALVS